ncbi:hypothetical protein FOD75_11545 (plasmid) [Limosilactobacillus reuteri]|uniref:Uncharacterized protein n=1 Tax=Limosilactobacillus reuteri TaxID=1598 RepID=A0A517D8N8_LIMRT|nr:hypothetical protein [Limosilactobacillus reuteri]QDR73715.1 hypothetical protein FOD75_11545 [Limosilactobacillus reuteri]
MDEEKVQQNDAQSAEPNDTVFEQADSRVAENASEPKLDNADYDDLAEDNASTEQSLAEQPSEQPHHRIVRPRFIETAERVPFDMLDTIASYRRGIDHELTENNLFDSIGEESTVYDMGPGENQQHNYVQMLRLRLTNGVAVYVPVNEIGAQYRYMDMMVGRKQKVSISNLYATDTFDEDGNPEYIAMGSILEAEFVVGGLMYSEFLSDSDKFKSETRSGTITSVVDTPTRQMIFFEYHGISLAMYAQDFYFRSYARPLSEVAHVGDRIRFKVKNIERIRYEDMNEVKRDVQAGRLTPKGYRYLIRCSSLMFRESPDDKVHRLQDSGSTFIARVVRYNPVLGILVEIAPGWWIKGRLPVTSNFKPTINDQFANTPVTVRINSIDYSNRNGSCQILSFPFGTAKTRDQKFN